MNINDLINLAGNDQIAAVGRQFGLDESQTRAAIEQLAPVIGAGVRRNAHQPQGLGSLLEALQRGNHSRYLDDPNAVNYENAAPEGNAILGHLFGSKDVSREVAMRASGSTGIGSSILKKLLPVIAAMVLGGIAKKAGASMNNPAPQPTPEPQARSGGIGDILSDIFGGGRSKPAGVPPTPMPQPQTRTRRTAARDDGIDMPTGENDPWGEPMGDAMSGDGSGDIGGFESDPFAEGGGHGRRNTHDFDHYDEDAFGRGRDMIDDMLGRGTSSGSAADDLLSSVERHLRGVR